MLRVKTKSRQIVVKLSDAEYGRLEKLCAANGESISTIVRSLINMAASGKKLAFDDLFGNSWGKT